MRPAAYLLGLTIAASTVIVTGVIAATGCQRKPAPLPEVDRPIELLGGPTLDGPAVDLATLRGKVVVVNFWSPS